MFENFTERTRRVMNVARQEASRLNHEFIGTEHILLGIVQEDGGLAAKVFKNLNVDTSKVVKEIERLVQPNLGPNVTLSYPPFSPRAKRVLALAQEEATKLHCEIIGTEQLLLGLLAEAEGIAAMVLQNLGVRLQEVREMVLDLLSADARDSKAETKSVNAADASKLQDKDGRPPAWTTMFEIVAWYMKAHGPMAAADIVDAIMCNSRGVLTDAEVTGLHISREAIRARKSVV